MGNEQPEERQVLGAMMLMGEGPWPAEVMALRPEHFENSHHGRIFAAIEELVQDGSGVDEILVDARLKSYGQRSCFAYLTELVGDTGAVSNLPHWSKVLLENGRRRIMDREISEAILSGGSADEMAVRVREAAAKAEASTAIFGGLEPVRNHVSIEVKQLADEASESSTVVSVKTGIPVVDRVTQLRPGQLTIIAGRPGMGKSALAGTIAAHVANRHGAAVAMFSLEMSRSEWIRRLLAAKARVSTSDLPKMAKSGELVEYAQRVHGLELWLDDRPRLTVDDIRTTLHRRMAHVDLVIVDYLQLANMGKISDRHDLQVGEATKGLRAIAKERSCHMIALSQLNRSVEKRSPPVPRLSDLRDSGNIEEDADHAWFLYRPGYYDQSQDQSNTELIIAKQRGGKIGTVSISFIPEQGKFVETATR